jgi:hypothetical protein
MPVAPQFTVNTKALFDALREFQATSKRDFGENLLLAGRGVIRNVIAITPPNRIEQRDVSGIGADGNEITGTMSTTIGGVQARKQGEAAIMSDLYRIFFPASAGFMKKFLHANPDGTQARDFAHKGQKSIGTVMVRVMSREQMRSFHRGKKNSKGRVRGGGEGGQLNFDHAESLKTGMNKAQLSGLEFAIVSPADFKAYAAEIKTHVGWLGHGWSAAASKLKVKMPKFMDRFESQSGGISIEMGPDKFSIKATNTVGYADDVRGYQRRIQEAVNRQAAAFAKRTAFFLDKRGMRLR